jgi:ABC-2 type transport system ATP-binding protein/lipopolysaccharide transport system ATP-binding protein
MSNSAIVIDHVSKRFQRSVDRRRSLKERIVRGRPTSTQDFWALRDVSVDIPKGSVYGLIGHNGSGKSTLLKLITGIYRPTSGTITTRGRIAALIELGAGFHPDMTGRENIRLNGAILGLSKREISEATEQIIDFSGLREFIDDPVKHYSSGMYVRLGFSVAVNLKPDILLVDEVLAVGDEEFQRKCFDHLTALRKTGTTIVVVSHGLGQIEALCDQVTWLDRGQVAETGPAHQVVSAYLEKVNSDESARNPRIEAVRTPGDRQSNSTIELTRATITDAAGNPLDHALTGTTFCVTVMMTAHEEVLGPNVRVALQHDSGPLVAMVNNHRHNVDFGYVRGVRTVTAAITNNPLLPGRYIVHLDVFDHTGSRVIDTWNNALEFVVRSPRGEIGQGFVDLPASFRIE